MRIPGAVACRWSISCIVMAGETAETARDRAVIPDLFVNSRHNVKEIWPPVRYLMQGVRQMRFGALQ